MPVGWATAGGRGGDPSDRPWPGVPHRRVVEATVDGYRRHMGAAGGGGLS